jgi:hypothetical protein
LVKKE